MMLHRVAYRAFMRYWLKRYATHLFAVSSKAAEGSFGKWLLANRSCQVMTGIDFSLFQTTQDSARIRAELGIANGTLIIGHVGSFRQQKNHQFFLKIAQELLSLRADIVFLLIGEGVLRKSIEEIVRALGMEEHFRFLGERDDVSQLLQVMDVFVFPSLYEGLPRVLLEAQLAGLPCVASSTITLDAAAEANSVAFVALQDEPQVWAQAVLNAALVPRSVEKATAAIRRFEERGLSIEANAKELTELYETIASTSSR
jgi:glycosyltransferase involved in cell wall biosynthesis